MERQSGIEYQAIVVADEFTGISIRHLFIKPPVKEKSAEAVAKATGTEHIDSGSYQNWSRFVIRRAVSDDSSEIISQVDRALQEFGHSAKRLEGLSDDPVSWQEFAIHMSRLDWEEKGRN